MMAIEKFAAASAFLLVAIAALVTPAKAQPAADAVRPFRVEIPEEALVDLRRRLAATRWPEKETAPDRSEGVKLATMKALVGYWQAEYDWRKAEAKLNAL